MNSNLSEYFFKFYEDLSQEDLDKLPAIPYEFQNENSREFLQFTPNGWEIIED